MMKSVLCLSVLVVLVAADTFKFDSTQDTVVMKQGSICYFWRLSPHKLESVQSPTGLYELEADYRHLLSVHTHFGDLADISIYASDIQTMCAGATLKTYKHH